ncbi:Gfo/Idh/MocA family protein [Bacteroidota bacterium]
MNKNNQRRKFIKKVLSASAGLITIPTIIPPHVLGLNARTAPSDRINMGFIGTGQMGTGHVRSFIGYEDVKAIAICDVRREHRDRAKKHIDEKYGNKDCKTYNDFRELLVRKDIDAILMACPDHWHALIGIEAARQNKDMYYEKPLSLFFHQCQSMRNAINRYGVVFQHGTQQRSDERYRFTVELVRNGRIGDLKEIVVASAGYPQIAPQPSMPVPDGLDYDMWLGPAPWTPYTELRCTRNFTLIYDYSVGCISGAYGIHDIDIAQWVVDADHTGPLDIEGTGVIAKDGLYDTILSWESTHTYENGVKLRYMDHRTARLKVPEYTAHNMGILFIGTEGWIFVQRGFMDAHPKSLLRTVIGPDEIRLPKSNDHRRNFLDCVKTRQQPICPIEVAVRSDTVCHQADIAIRLGRKLQWDPVREAFKNDMEANRMLSRPMRSPWQL